jgi:hypothetical protein
MHPTTGTITGLRATLSPPPWPKFDRQRNVQTWVRSRVIFLTHPRRELGTSEQAVRLAVFACTRVTVSMANGNVWFWMLKQRGETMIAPRSTSILSAFLTVVCAALTLQSASSSAEPRHKKQQAEQTRSGRSQAKTVETADHIRAVSCDPTGSYAAYPDWARAALSCGKR